MSDKKTKFMESRRTLLDGWGTFVSKDGNGSNTR